MVRGKVDLFRMACLAVACAISAVAAGCGGGGGGGTPAPPQGDTTGPTVTNVNAVDTLTTGDVYARFNITSRVTDTSGVKSVKAVITKPDKTTVDVPMTGTTDFTGSWTVQRSTTATVVYPAKIVATDTLGNTTSSPTFNIEVESVEGPPPPPVIGQ